MKLHGYWRSTAAWRVRLALHLKGIAHEQVAVNLLQGEQRSAAHLALNPQGLVPVLETEGAALSQSLAIIEYLDERFPQPPLLPADALGRARVRAAALTIAAEVHPLGNLRVQRWLKAELHADDAAVTAWLHHWMHDGLGALEQFSAQHGGNFLFGDAPGLADLCLVPQLYNINVTNAGMRFGTALNGKIDVNASAAWQRTSGAREAATQIGIPAVGQLANIRSVSIDKDALLLQAGLGANLSDKIRIGVDYSGLIGARNDDHGARATLNFAF
ncbi:MAG: maleylacetoacetate isomerase [Pseudomonadota bacterium]|jgi:maleylacetoacetate isomerase|uniref:maleylacetoacetate isomerase n=1 Tax=Sandarakinorhabdus limnophila TaxID=210512 RepID=UPI0026F326CC|nr:maleylacetoacetate isomerase [Sandarakinorhabdus limnophila]